MTKIDIISGFLGAGKTTLIKTLLKGPLKGEKVALIENEVGNVSIDGVILEESGVQMREIVSGCICCTRTADFYSAAREMIGEFAPDRILIEPTGVARLSDVKACVQDMEKGGLDVKLDRLITVVDGQRIVKLLKALGGFVVDQIENASLIMVSRTQLMDEDEIQKVEDALREINGSAEIVTAPWDI